jgi:hypothetical protein
VKCLGCGYSLRSLQARTCPECGRPFDLSDHTTFDRSTTAESFRHRALRWTAGILTGVAVLHLVLGWSAWAVSRLVLGHAPGYYDAPSSISQIRVLRATWFVSGVALPLMVPMILVLIAFLWVEPDPSHGGPPRRHLTALWLGVWTMLTVCFCGSSGVWVWLAA